MNKTQRLRNAANSKPRAVVLKHGGASALVWARLDKRSREHAYIEKAAAELVQHLGGHEQITTPVAELIGQAARLKLLQMLLWASIIKEGLQRLDGSTSPAFDAYLRTSDRLADRLTQLGLARPTKPIPDLHSYLESKAAAAE